MQASFLAAVIGLGGCSAVELAYDNAHWLIRYQIEEYFNLTDDQEEFLDHRLKALIHWHRDQELPQYADYLQQFARLAHDGLTRSELQRFFELVNQARLRLLKKSLPDLAKILATLSPEQLREFDTKIRTSWREQFTRFNRSAEEWRNERFDKFIDILESWVGDLSEPQIQHIKALTDQLPDDFPQWMTLRQRRHEVFMRMMMKRPDARTIYERLDRWWSNVGANTAPEFRRIRDRWWNARLNLLLEIDKIVTPDQRRHALEQLTEIREEFTRLSARRRK